MVICAYSEYTLIYYSVCVYIYIYIYMYILDEDAPMDSIALRDELGLAKRGSFHYIDDLLICSKSR